MTECPRVPWTPETAWSICINELGGGLWFLWNPERFCNHQKTWKPHPEWHMTTLSNPPQRLRRTVTWLGRTPRAPRTPLDSYNLSSQVTDSICSIFKRPVQVALLFCLPAQPGKSLSPWLTTILPWTIVCELRHSLLLTHWTGKSWF